MTDTSRVISDEIAAEKPDAVLHERDGRWVLTMTRLLAHPPERVWSMLTEPAQLARWSAVVPDRPLDSTGPATSRETPDTEAVAADVLVHDAPRELVHRWDDHVLRWTLEPVPEGTRLVLEHTFDARTEAGSYAAGWHLCFAVLAALIAGRDVPQVVGGAAVDHGWEEPAGLRRRRAGDDRIPPPHPRAVDVGPDARPPAGR